MNYDELRYKLPELTEDLAIKRAVSILEDIASIDYGCLFYVLQPSNVLALAGLRAQSPYNDFEPTFATERQRLLDDLLQTNGCSIQLEQTNNNAKNSRLYFVMCHDAFQELPMNYAAIQPIWKELYEIGDFEKFSVWSERFESLLESMMFKNKLPKEWLADSGAPHNVRFGMLLGYPGQAISSSCWFEAKKEDKDKQIITASMPFQGLFCGAHVTYDYLSGLKSNPVIQKHQMLWTNVLEGVYKVFPKQRLLKIPEFNEEYKRFKLYDENRS